MDNIIRTFLNQLGYGVVMLLSVTIPLFALAVVYIIWLCYLKEEKTEGDTTSIPYPPEGLDFLEVGYIFNGGLVNEDAHTLLLELAISGYILIEEEQVKNPFGASTPYSTYKIHKIREYEGDNKNLSLYFHALFRNSTTESCQSSTEKAWYQLLNTIEQKPEIEYIICGSYSYRFRLSVTEIAQTTILKMKDRKVFQSHISTKKTLIISMIVLAYLGMCLPAFLETPYSKWLFVTMPLVSFLDYYLIRLLIHLFTKKNYVMTVSGMEGKYPKHLIVILAIMLISFIFAFSFFEQSATDTFQYTISSYCLGQISIFLISYFSTYSGKRSEEGKALFRNIEGFREFIKKTNSDEIAGILANQPNYIEKVLPFIYILSLDRDFADNIRNIELIQPIWFKSYKKFTTRGFFECLEAFIASSHKFTIPPNNGD